MKMFWLAALCSALCAVLVAGKDPRKFGNQEHSQSCISEWQNHCLACEAEARHMYCFPGGVVVVGGDKTFCI